MENESRTIEFADCSAFYLCLQKLEGVEFPPQVIAFKSIIDSIPNSCGCVKGTLNERAAGQYGCMLPLIQVTNPEFFDNIKKKLEVNQIIFKENENVLLVV